MEREGPRGVYLAHTTRIAISRSGSPILLGAATAAVLLLALAFLFGGWTWVFGVAGVIALAIAIGLIRESARRAKGTQDDLVLPDRPASSSRTPTDSPASS